ncbi:hypothetical protein J6590_019691 [Homalodisca vitripennis]|nr:hypothetical protein J6590_019691 [Homalodisca vitripennis]
MGVRGHSRSGNEIGISNGLETQPERVMRGGSLTDRQGILLAANHLSAMAPTTLPTMHDLSAITQKAGRKLALYFPRESSTREKLNTSKKPSQAAAKWFKSTPSNALEHVKLEVKTVRVVDSYPCLTHEARAVVERRRWLKPDRCNSNPSRDQAIVSPMLSDLGRRITKTFRSTHHLTIGRFVRLHKSSAHFTALSPMLSDLGRRITKTFRSTHHRTIGRFVRLHRSSAHFTALSPMLSDLGRRITKTFRSTHHRTIGRFVRLHRSSAHFTALSPMLSELGRRITKPFSSTHHRTIGRFVRLHRSSAHFTALSPMLSDLVAGLTKHFLLPITALPGVFSDVESS